MDYSSVMLLSALLVMLLVPCTQGNTTTIITNASTVAAFTNATPASTMIFSSIVTASTTGIAKTTLMADDVSASTTVMPTTETTKSNPVATSNASTIMFPTKTTIIDSTVSASITKTQTTKPSAKTTITTKTTTTTTTKAITSEAPVTMPTTTSPTTLSPAQKHALWCNFYFESWLPNNTACTQNGINKECYQHTMNISNEYLRCKSILYLKEVSDRIAKYNSMYFQAYLKFFGKTMLQQFFVERENDPKLKNSQTEREVRLVFSNMIWITGFQFRYSGMSWPNYHNGYKRKRWNKRNDTIIVPYGSLPRAVYRYRFALYDSLWTGPLSKGLVRLKRKWPPQHDIRSGEFVSYEKEPNLFFKSMQKINSAVIQLYVEPVKQNPLPGKLTIALNHLHRNMTSPMCVYWQDVVEYHSEDIPPHGYWSNYGMEVKYTNKTMTLCSASHYGTFALLMEPILPPVHKPMSTVDILTIIMSLLSMVMLVGFLISMAMLECYKSIQNRIYIYIAISMFFAHLFFFLGIFTSGDFDTCTNLMTLYELAYMFVVTWYMMDGIHQLNQITPLFNPKTSANAFYVIVGVGLPLAVLIAMLEFPYPEFTELPYCWPNVDGAYYLYFIGPLGVVILVTSFLRLLTFKKLRVADKKELDNVNYVRAFIGIKSTCVILVTCIIYWIIASAGIKKEVKTAEVLQVILSAIQIIISGQIIFYYFHRNDEVADALEEQRKILERIRLNKMDHLAGVCMDVKYIPNPNDENENLQTEIEAEDDVDKKFNKFDSMFGLNSSVHSSTPECERGHIPMGEFTSETNLIM